MVSFYGQDKKPFLAVVRTLDQIPTRDEKGNKVELLSRAMSRGERLKPLGSCNDARSEGTYYEGPHWKRRKVQYPQGSFLDLLV